MKHTETPWESYLLVDCAEINTASKHIIAELHCGKQLNNQGRLEIDLSTCHANARFIVKAVNNHDRLFHIVRLFVNQCELTGQHDDLYEDAKEVLNSLTEE